MGSPVLGRRRSGAGLEICIVVSNPCEKLIWPSSLHPPGETEPERGGDWPKMTRQNWTGARPSGPWYRMFSNPAFRQGSLPQRRGGEAHADIFPEYLPGAPRRGCVNYTRPSHPPRNGRCPIETEASRTCWGPPRRQGVGASQGLGLDPWWGRSHHTGGKLWSDLRRASLPTRTWRCSWHRGPKDGKFNDWTLTNVNGT